MGIDINMVYLDKDNQIVEAENFDGRNSEWFANISGRGNDWEYEDFPTRYLADDSPEAKAIGKVELAENDFYGFELLHREDFLNWYNMRKPHIKCGWVSKVTAWKMEVKNYIPCDMDVMYESVDEYTEFMEFVNPYDCSSWLAGVLNSNPNIKKVIYYFDC